MSWRIFLLIALSWKIGKTWHIFEIQYMVGLKVKWVFSGVIKVKTDWRKVLRQKYLHIFLVCQDGHSVEDFNTNHASNAWYDEKIQEKIHDKTNLKQTGPLSLMILISYLNNTSMHFPPHFSHSSYDTWICLLWN